MRIAECEALIGKACHLHEAQPSVGHGVGGLNALAGPSRPALVRGEGTALCTENPTASAPGPSTRVMGISSGCEDSEASADRGGVKGKEKLRKARIAPRVAGGGEPGRGTSASEASTPL